MSVPVPLAVRLYSAPQSFDQYITKWIENFTFRSTAPGGFVNGTFKIRWPNLGAVSDVTIWTPTTSSASTDTTSFKVTDANATNIKYGDRFWVYTTGGALRFNGERYTVIGTSSSGGITTVTYYPATPATIASGETVTAKSPLFFNDTGLIGFNKWLQVYTRIQVLDVRTGEIAWEGRLDEPAREAEKNVWTLSALGNSVYSTDIKRPMCYMDVDAESWFQEDFLLNITDLFDSLTVNGQNETIIANFHIGTIFAAHDMYNIATFRRMKDADLEDLGRIDGIFDGVDGGSTAGRLGISLSIGGQSESANYPLNGSSDLHFNKVVGQFPSGVNEIHFQAGCVGGSGVTVSSKSNGTFRLPRVQPMRIDRYGTLLNAAANYPDGAVRPYFIVEDVLGRLLNNRHRQGPNADTPYWAWVNPYTSYVDTSSGTSILLVSGLTWYDGATAKDILDKMVEAQPNAYWAIWESGFYNTDNGFNAKARFTYELWPNSWGYRISSQDGLYEQPDASTQYNFVFYQYTDSGATSSPGSSFVYTQENWAYSGSDMDDQNVTRAQTLKRNSPTDSTTAFNESSTWVQNSSRAVNSGSITVRRPVLFYDSGLNGITGGARRLDPWMLRPGKNAWIYDLMPRAGLGSFPYGDTLPNRALDDTIFKVVETEYDAASNSCRMSLDQKATWSVPLQIVTPRKAAASTSYIYGP